jgi:hypothetical protein
MKSANKPDTTLNLHKLTSPIGRLFGNTWHVSGCGATAWTT